MIQFAIDTDEMLHEQRAFGAHGVLEVELLPATDEFMEETEIWYIEMQTPIGLVVVTSDGDAVTGLYMESHKHRPVNRDYWIHDVREEIAVLRAAKLQLAEYFAGERTEFDLPLAATGSDVQKVVWRELSNIPYGETRSYGEIARIIGKPKASRAVGSANGRNPISIIVPCHRVIGADGSLTGFGGGIERKQWLLAHEAKVAGTAQLMSMQTPR
ncbi:MAG: methylated-DNA--[protein]-cysteine S-methyltransferase [Gemmatimonadaceae bacterium]